VVAMMPASTWTIVPYEGRSAFKRLRIRDNARIQAVLRHITDRNYVAVLGAPFTEKTRLLHDIAAAAETTGLFQAVYIDLWRVRSEDVPAFFASIVRSIARSHGISPVPGFDRVTDTRSFANFLMDCAEHQDRNIVLTIDHLHALPSDLVHNLLVALRSAYMERDPLARRHLEAVVTGSTNLAGLATGPASPFNMARRVWVTPLDSDQSKALAETTLETYGFRVSPGALERILEWAGGDHWLLPLLCEYSVEAAHAYRKRIIRVPAVDCAIQRMWATNEAQAPIRDAIRIIEEDPDTLLDVTQLLDGVRLHQRQARQAITRSGIDRLRLSGAVVLDAGHYNIKNLAFRRALSEELTNAEVGRVLRMNGRWREAIDYLSPRLTSDALPPGRADLLEAIVQSIYATDRLDEACQALVEGIKRGFLLADVHVYRVDVAHGKLRLVCPPSSNPQLAPDIALDDPECVEAQAYRSGDYALRMGDETGRLVAALVPEHRPIGVVTIERYITDVAPYITDGGGHALPPNFTELRRFLRHAATAIDSVMLRSAYQEIGRAVLDVRAVHPMFDRVLTSVANAVGCDYAALHLLDSTETRVEASAGVGQDWRPEWRGTLRVSVDEPHPIARCLQGDQPLIVRGVDLQLIAPTFYNQVLSPYLRVFSPLSAGGARLGTLEVGYHGRPKGTFTEDDRHMLTVFADQVAIAVYNAQLLRRTDEALARRVAEMEKLREISLAVSATLNLETVLASIIQSLGALFPHTEVTVWQYQPESRTLTALQSSLNDPEYLAQRLDLAGVTGRALEQRASQTIMDIGADADSAIRSQALRLGFCSMMALPLISHDRILGAIHIYATADDCSVLTERESLAGFATQAAIAIDNAQRYQALEEAKRELEDTRERELFDLANALLHRIGNVVGDVPFQLDMIKERAGLGDELDSPIAHVQQRVKSLGSLSESLKTLVEIPEMLNQRLDLRQVIQSATRQAMGCRFPAEQFSDVEPLVSMPLTPVWVVGDPELLADAIQSLIENACEAMEGKRKVEIRLSRPTEAWIELRVSDTGPGIPLEIQPRIFEPGYSTKSTLRRERGRGLFSCAAIIRKHRGKVTFDSQPGQGTTFIITLPAAEDENSPQPDGSQ
jgi:signal transduction histidine kinase